MESYLYDGRIVFFFAQERLFFSVFSVYAKAVLRLPGCCAIIMRSYRQTRRGEGNEKIQMDEMAVRYRYRRPSLLFISRGAREPSIPGGGRRGSISQECSCRRSEGSFTQYESDSAERRAKGQESFPHSGRHGGLRFRFGIKFKFRIEFRIKFQFLTVATNAAREKSCFLEMDEGVKRHA